jgi:hypothetical protein
LRLHTARDCVIPPPLSLLTESVAPELLSMEAKWSSLVSCGMSLEALKDFLPLEEDVSQVLIPGQRGRPNSYRLMKSPITRSCMCSVLEKHSVRRTRRLIRVRRLICLLSIFWVFSLPT